MMFRFLILRAPMAVMLAAIHLGGAQLAEGAISTWDGGAGNLNWYDTGANNWDPDGVPANGSQIQFNGGAGAVPAAAIVSMAGTTAYPSPVATEIDFNNGAAFTLGNFTAGQYTYWPTLKVQDAFDYAIAVTSTGELTISGTTTVDVVAGGSLTVNGGFTASGFSTGTLLKTGAGAMYLTGGKPLNPSTINMIVQGGKLSATSVDDLGTGYLAAQTGGTLEYTGNGSESKTGFLYWNNGSAILDVTSPTGNLTLNVTGGDLTSGGGTFTKAGAGTLSLSTAGIDLSLAKPVSVAGGTLALDANDGNIIRITSSVSGAAGTSINVLAGTGTVRNDALTANWSANLASLDVASGGAFDLRGNNVTVAGLNGGGSITNSFYQANSGISGHQLTVGVNDGSGEFSGSISGTGTTGGVAGQISLNKIGAGTQTLTGNNNYGGTTTITGGTLSVNSVNAIAPAESGSGSYLAIQTGGALQYIGVAAESVTKWLYLNNGSATIDVTSPTGNLTLNVAGGSLTGGGGTFTKAGDGTLTLSTAGVNIALPKPVAITGGTLALAANGANLVQLTSGVSGAAGTSIHVVAGTVRNDALAANWNANLASLDVASGATFDLRGNNVTVNALSGGGSIINSFYQADSGINGHQLTIGVNDGSGAFSGVISGTGTTAGVQGQVSVIKLGSGTQTFSGDNTYTGTTTINAGTLLVNGAHTGGGTFLVNSGGTLGGEGSIDGITTILSGGTLAAGNSPGNLTFNNNLSLGGTYAWELGDLTFVENLLTLQLTWSLEVLPGFDLLGRDPVNGFSVKLFEYGSTSFLAPSSVTGYGGYLISDVRDDGLGSIWLDNVTMVPEPSSLLLLGLGTLGLAAYVRRRRSSGVPALASANDVD